MRACSVGVALLLCACSPEPAPPAALAAPPLPRAVMARAAALQPCPRLSLVELEAALGDGVAGQQTLLRRQRGYAPRCAREAERRLLQLAAYQQALARLPAVAGLRARIDAIHRLRASAFDPAARTALFAEEEDYERYQLACAVVRDNPAFDAAARRAAQLALQSLLPASVRAARSAAMAPVEWLHTEAALRAAAAPDAVLDAARRARFGAAAARRLAQLDAERAVWQERVQRYHLARRSILAREPDGAARAGRLQRLRDQHFTSREVLRLEAYAAED